MVRLFFMARSEYSFIAARHVSFDSRVSVVTKRLLAIYFLSGTIVSIDLDRREIVDSSPSSGYRVVHLVYPPTRVVIFIQSAFDAGLRIPPFNRGEIAVGVETRAFEVKGLHERLYVFKRAQLPLLPGHLSSVYRAQVMIPNYIMTTPAPLPTTN